MENFEKFDMDLDELKTMLSQQLDENTTEETPVAWEPVTEETPEVEPEQEEKKGKKNKEPDSWEKTVLMYLHDLIYLLGALMILSLLLVRVVVVSGTSMNRTLLDGDYLFVLSNTVYQDPEYGDIVVISKESFDDGKPIVKRVIATEGQWVNIDFEKGIVYVGESLSTMKALDEPYVNTATVTREGVSFPLQVEEGCIFVLGDNRAVSRDSRSPEIGMIDEKEVLGKVIFLFLPGTNGTDALGNPKESRDFGRIGVVQ